MGTKYLQKILHEQLGKHIKERLPGIRRALQEKVQQLELTLQDCGGYIKEDENKNKTSLVLKLVQKFNYRLESQIEGQSLKVPLRSVGPGAAINRTLYGEVHDYIQNAVSTS